MPVISTKELLAYQKEVGYGFRSDGLKLTIEDLRAANSRLKSLLTDGRYGREISRAKTISKHKNTHKTRIHELAKVTLDIDKSLVEAKSTNNISVSKSSLAQLAWAPNMFMRWSNHPAYGRIVEELADSSNYFHNLMALVVASYFIDLNNGATLNFLAKESEPLPDITVIPKLAVTFNVEVKTPQCIGVDQNEDTDEQLIKVIRATLSKACKQLGSGEDGLVAIGSLNLTEKSFQNTAKLVEKILNRPGNKKTHLYGVLLFNMCASETAQKNPPRIIPVAKVEIIKHTHYEGVAKIEPVRQHSS
jgi:hypothetical protein